jgi:DNA-binding transcriptional LysR family regulator
MVRHEILLGLAPLPLEPALHVVNPGDDFLEPADTNYFDAGQLILDAAAGGLGVAFMLYSHLASSVDGRLVQQFEETAESPDVYWFACMPAALERRLVRIFYDWLFEHFGAAEGEYRAAAE